MNTLWTSATIVTMDASRRTLYGASLYVEDGRIVALGPDAELAAWRDQADRIIDCEGNILFPGLINTHTHSFQTLLKGLAADTTLDEWLANVITPSVTAIGTEDLYHAARLSAIDALQTGTTTILDYQYVQAGEGLNEAAIRGYRDAGMRLVYGRGFADDGVQFGANPDELEPLARIQEETEALIETWHGEDDGMVRIALAPSALWMCSPACLAWAADCSRRHGVLVTSHTAETSYDNECSLALHGADDFGALEKYGLLGERMLLVHGVKLSEEQVERMAKSGTRFSYNAVSNMYLASGAAPIPWMKRAGVVGSLGTDGAASNNANDMLETLKSSILLAKAASRDAGVMSALDGLAWATCDGAKALGMQDEIGSLEVNKRADLFLFVPGRSAKASACHDPVSTLAYSCDARNVDKVMVDGVLVVDDGRMLPFDEGDAIRTATEHAQTLVRRIGMERVL